MLELLLIAWAALLLTLVGVAIAGPSQGGALMLAYFIGLSLIHVPGAFIFVASHLDIPLREPTLVGFEMTVIGMGAFVAGVLLAHRIYSGGAVSRTPRPPSVARIFEQQGWRGIAAGAVTYFIFIPLSFAVPSLTSVVSAVATLLIIGFWLMLYGAAIADQRGIVTTVAALPLLPLATLVAGGYLGYGINWVVSVIAFLFVIVRRRAAFYLAAPLAVYLGLSLFVTYMGERTAIREVVWQENSTLVERLDRVSMLATQFQFLDLNSRAHVVAISDRLNQNELVGIAVDRHEKGWSEFAYGETVPVWALIPRAFWSDKPGVGGGLDVVGDFTGIHFWEGTSVGAGQVLEFYVNFGVSGLMIGFALLGFVLKWLDDGITRALIQTDTRGLLIRAMPGLTLLQPGGNLLEIILAAVAAFIVANLIVWLGFLDLSLAERPANSKQMQSDCRRVR